MPDIRRTKILATLGPATDKPGVLEKLFYAGVDAVRLNFSHGSAQDHIDRANNVREISKKTGRRIGILADLQGPKIRIARFSDDKVWLDEGQSFALDINLSENAGDNTHVGITYETLAREVQQGSRLLLDDGRVVLDVVDVVNGRINCTVVVGGYLSNNKGINLLGGGLSAAALTAKDKEDILTIGKIQADFVAVSFPRCADDLNLARKLLADVDCYPGIVAKVERAEAMQKDVMDEIILASDVIMVARGDLGVEIGDANLPAAQKILISRSRELDRAVITATQMMESMIESPIPTRAEVFDVANAVLDGTDAIMLSAETAAGKYPVQAVEAMVRVCMETDKQRAAKTSKHRVDTCFKRKDEAIALAAMYMANHSDVQGLVSLTESGATPLWMSRIRSGLPIFAFSSREATLGRVTLFRGVIPIFYEYKNQDHVQLNRDIIALLKKFNYAVKGDTFIITKGDLTGQEGGTNALKIVTVGEGLIPE
ncbi:MAG: pyruvate kinase [Methyloprofundus sp.]